MWLSRSAAALIAALLLPSIASGGENPAREPGSRACAGCHAKIYNSYSKTAMATASGFAVDGLITGDFTHSQSGAHFRVYKEGNNAWMSYDRPSEPSFRGQRELSYFIGSGKKGRTYVFSLDGFFFESPINWYSQENRWNMAPAYTDTREVPLNLPLLLDCLNCHVSGVQSITPGTDNQFSGKPFLHRGITCERCHGTGTGHLQGSGSIIDPAKLPPTERDAVCMECHFEGSVAIKQPGKELYQFEPGDRLSDYVHYFLLTRSESHGPQALSQFEALSLSECKRKSGDKMSCLSCHDPHQEPAAADRLTYYRGKCLACHGEDFARKHHPDKPSCTECHMPSLPSQDVDHTQATDHRILRHPDRERIEEPLRDSVRLTPFPVSETPDITTRDLALAWENLSQRQVPGASHEAEHYLRQALKDRPSDPELLSALGFEEQEHGKVSDARALYETALKLDPLNNDAATDLGVLEARSGNLKHAIVLWQRAFERVPYESAVGTNLATVLCTLGQIDQARSYTRRVLEFNPDYSAAKRLMTGLNLSPPRCGP